jgi:hypothetical protein
MEATYSQNKKECLINKNIFEYDTKDSEENVCAFLDQFFKGSIYQYCAHMYN